MAFRETSIELKQNDHILYSWRDIKFAIQIEFDGIKWRNKIGILEIMGFFIYFKTKFKAQTLNGF